MKQNKSEVNNKEIKCNGKLMQNVAFAVFNLQEGLGFQEDL